MNRVSRYRNLLRAAPADHRTRRAFLRRLAQGKLTRDENPTSHFCAYFAAYDPHRHRVFIGHHKKSGHWLFNGGHIDRGELPLATVQREMIEEWGQSFHLHPGTLPNLLTLTRIDRNPAGRACRWHYDIWYFVPVTQRHFKPKRKLLAKEFFINGWKTISAAHRLTADPSTKRALRSFNEKFRFVRA